MTTQLQPVLKPDKVPPANEGRVNPLSADERLLRKAVDRCLKAQVAEVHGKVEGSKASAVPSNLTKWDKAVVREIRPIWFGLFKKGGDRALKEIRRFPKHTKKMAVLNWAEMEASERVEVKQKGGLVHVASWSDVFAVDFKGSAGSGNFGHEGRPGKVGGSGGGKGGVGETPKGDLVREVFREVAGLHAGQVLGTINEDGGIDSTIAGKGDTHDTVNMPHSFMEKRWRYDPEENGVFSWSNLSSVEEANLRDHIKDRYGKEPAWIRTPNNPGAGRKFLEIQATIKAVSNRSSIVIPDWIEDPDVLDALEREMFKFAHGIDQTTADALRDELMAGMEDGETISQLANRISDISDEWVEGWRSEMIARTETARAFTTGHIEAWRSTGVVSRKIWVSSGDCCPFCAELDGTVIELDENFYEQGDDMDAEWRGQEIVMENSYSDMNGPPAHPNCLVHGSSQVYTSKGWKRIADIRAGELVLTHKGRFRKVAKTHRNQYAGNAVKIEFGRAGRYLTVTDEHPVLVNGKWTMAKDVKKGDSLSILGHSCARCGKITMWNMKYCSHTCLSLDITDAQRADPEHRKIISRKASEQLKREYANGTRDKSTILLKARKQMDKLVAEGIRVRPFDNPEVRKKLDLAMRDPGRRRRSSIRMQRNNPSTIPEVRARMTKSYKAMILLHPERHPNYIMAQQGFMSSIERKVKELLDAIGIAYTQQHPVDRFFVDFAIPSLMVAIEVDGHYWHKDGNPKDAARQKIIEDAGWHVVRFGEDRINEDLQSVSQELVRIAANHAGEYKFADVKVLSVKRWILGKPRMVYNLSVAEDESYIAKGMVVHNCRCVLIAELDESTNTEEQ